MRKSFLWLLVVAALTAFTGCSSFQPPQPWEKGDLAKSTMLMGGDPLGERFAEHIYSSRENASGGYGVGGGGCGCN